MVIDVYGDRLDAVFIDASATVMDSFTMVKGVDTLPPVIIFAEAVDSTTVSVHFA